MAALKQGITLVLAMGCSCAWAARSPAPAKAIPAPAVASVPSAAAMTVDQITQCSRANIPEKTAVMELELNAYDREGNAHKLKARVYLQRMENNLTRAMLRLRYPPDISGSSYLVVEQAEGNNSTYVYLPDVQRTRRLVLQKDSTTLWTTDFSFEDVTQIQGLTGKGEATRLPDAEQQGRPVYVLSIKTDPAEASSYESVTSYVDQKTCVPLRTEFYGYGHKLRKVLSVDAKTIRRQGGFWQPHNFDMRDVVAGTHTSVAISDLHYDEKVAASVFNPMSFYQYHGR